MTINWPLTLLNLQIILDASTAIAYASQHNWKQTLYWVSVTGVVVAVRWIAS